VCIPADCRHMSIECELGIKSKTENCYLSCSGYDRRCNRDIVDDWE